MEKIIYRRDNKFHIDKSKLKAHAKRDEIYNALYAEIYLEFSGAVNNPVYKDLTPLARIEKLNEFAYNWLKNRGFI